MASTPHQCVLLCLLFLSFFPPKYVSQVEEKRVLLEFKSHLKDPTDRLSSWLESKSACEFSGVSCDPETGRVTGILFDNASLVGEILPSLCRLQSLSYLVLTSNSIFGNIPPQLSQCNSLKVLNLSMNRMVGRIPDLSGVRTLEVLDLSTNFFTGEFPTWVGNLTGLASLGLANNMFSEGRIPKSLGNLNNLTWLYLSNCRRVGEIPESIYGLKELSTFDLSRNKITGMLSKSISEMRKLTKIELFYNNLTGKIPRELASLTLVQEFDISSNHFYGNLPPEIGNLKNLAVFQLYENEFTGEFPLAFGDLQHLKGFSIYRNSFSGEFPPNFGRFSPLRSIDISENKFTGSFPSYLCQNRSLQFLLALENEFSGEFPSSYADCKTLVRFRINQNRLSGQLSDGVWAMPDADIIDFSSNNFTGDISSEIAKSSTLSQLILENNKFSGSLPPEIGKLTQLERLYLSNNSFSGKIPVELGALKKLSSLQLQGNILDGPVPSELGQCIRLVDLNLASNLLSGNIPGGLAQIFSLNSLNLSNNRFTGLIPQSLGTLKLSLIDLSKNQLSGIVPSDLLEIGSRGSFLGNKALCVESNTKTYVNYGLGVCYDKQNPNRGLSTEISVTCVFLTVLVVALIVLLLVNYRHYKVEGMEEKDSKWKVESFHHLEFDIDEICNVKEQNLIGSGGYGKVYRLDLRKNGGTVAVKQVRTGTGFQVLSAEINILGKIRHKNILKLYACLLRGGTGFLVFEYMPKGNLHEALGKEIKGGEAELDWYMRFKIALGVAKGLAYLHHDCSPPIVHRDIKSTNILLDEEYEPKIADFGVAKARDDSPEGSEHSCFAGTHGYIAPELAYTRKITEKSDVYSFGVVLLEVVTGRSPVEEQYGEGKDIIYWVLSCLNNQIDVLDHRVMSANTKDDMMKVLKIATLCTTKLPSLRPTMKDVVKMLVDADPRTFRSVHELSDKTQKVLL